MDDANEVMLLLKDILEGAEHTILYKGRKTYALGDVLCPVDTAAQYVINELHKLMAEQAALAKAAKAKA